MLEPAALPQVEVIQRARAHADEHLAGIELRIGRVLVPQDLRSAVLVESDGLHKKLVSW